MRPRQEPSILKTAFILFILTAFFPFAGAAEEKKKDDVLDAAMEAIELYKNQEYSEAAEMFGYAAQQSRQKKGELLKVGFPEPLENWTAEKANVQSAGAAFLGGGIILSQDYKKDRSKITITIAADSPMIQSTLMMLTNPMFAQGNQGSLERIRGHKAVVKYEEKRNRGEVNIVVKKRYLVTVKGRQVDKDTILEYAKGVKFKELLSIP